jgi:hypothetical protein
VTDATRQLRCAWCHQPFSVPARPGPAPSYCRRSHRQRAFEARRLAETNPAQHGTQPPQPVTVTPPAPSAQPPPSTVACPDQPYQRPQAGLGWPPHTRRSRDPVIELLFTLSDELADLWNAACKVDALRADLDHADPDHPVDPHRLSDAVDAAIGGDTPHC